MRTFALTALAFLAACGPNRTYPDRDAYAPAAVQPLECVPNLDGVIEATELETAFGVPVSYLVNPAGSTRPVNVVGEVNAQGQLVWDLGVDYADDQVAKLVATAPTGKWWASSFPAAQFTTPLDLAGRIDGVYANDGSNLLLLGYASSLESPPEGKTLVVYTQPVAIFRFPLQAPKEWVSVGEVRNATVRGLPFAGRDTYTVKVDATGILELPDVAFTQALRVRTTALIEPSVGASIVRRQVGWVFECFGEVARATAPDNETNDDFTTAAELRRLGL
ncbi:MAG: hypothetical protein AB1938_00275 [Myxococcota bacterium]